MKKILAIYKAYMVRPILYQCVTRCAVALAAVLVWDRFVPSSLLAVRDGCLAAAVILLMMAWFVYLKLDGMMVHHLLEDRRKKKKEEQAPGRRRHRGLRGRAHRLLRRAGGGGTDGLPPGGGPAGRRAVPGRVADRYGAMSPCGPGSPRAWR